MAYCCVECTPKVLKRISQLACQASLRMKATLEDLNSIEKPRSIGRTPFDEGHFRRYRFVDNRIIVAIEDQVVTNLVHVVAHRGGEFRLASRGRV